MQAWDAHAACAADSNDTATALAATVTTGARCAIDLYYEQKEVSSLYDACTTSLLRVARQGLLVDSHFDSYTACVDKHVH
jgi:hypothetical protein